MSKALLLVNSKARGGQAVRVFERIRNELDRFLGAHHIVITESASEVQSALDAAKLDEMDRVIAVGGDGTLHALTHAIMEGHGPGMAVGCLPVGTGLDWSRSLGMPKDPFQALQWLAGATPMSCDVGQVLAVTPQGESISRWFLNVASAGISGEVDWRVNQAKKRSSLTFFIATLTTLLRYRALHMQVTCDQGVLYEGQVLMVVVGNGQYFGHGMHVTPQALINDGQFQVVLAQGMPLWRSLFLFPSLYRGTHLRYRVVCTASSSRVTVRAMAAPMILDLDGEPLKASEASFSVKPKALSILLHPSQAPLAPSNSDLLEGLFNP